MKLNIHGCLYSHEKYAKDTLLIFPRHNEWVWDGNESANDSINRKESTQ